MPETLNLEIALTGGLLLAVLAFLLGRATSAGGKRLTELQSTLDDALAQREEARRDADDYRARVASHFEQTSHQLHDLTLQYRAVYDHLAQGASELCPEGFEKLEGGLGLDALPEESGEAAAAAEDEQAAAAGEPAAAADEQAEESPKAESAEESAEDAPWAVGGADATSETAADEGVADEADPEKTAQIPRPAASA